ncbi:MAG: thiamine diphosphokinase [Clostridia bacterium]|nr:thiamine diphosphokinase [Clostridia bacterium]
MSKAVIISAGTITDYGYTKAFIEDGDFVICADGGLTHAERMGITPNLTVGDFDSYKGDAPGEVRKFNPEKDYTDTHIAVSAALEKGYKKIVLLGAMGTRLDHTMANIGLLEYIAKNGAVGEAVNENNTATVITGNAVIKNDGSKYVSIIPVGRAKGVTLKNFKYLLNDYDMEFSQSIGISNEFLSGDGIVEIKEGSLIVIKSKD